MTHLKLYDGKLLLTKRRHEILYRIVYTDDVVFLRNEYLSARRNWDPHNTPVYEPYIGGVNCKAVVEYLRGQRLVRTIFDVTRGAYPFVLVITDKGMDAMLAYTAHFGGLNESAPVHKRQRKPHTNAKAAKSNVKQDRSAVPSAPKRESNTAGPDSPEGHDNVLPFRRRTRSVN